MEKGFPPYIIMLLTGFFLLFLPSCTSLSFEGKGLIPLYVSARPDHKTFVELEGTKEFYLWGLIGPDHTVYMDEEFYNQGLISVADISVQEFQKASNFWKAFFSFGFYIPKNYRLTGHGLTSGDFE